MQPYYNRTDVKRGGLFTCSRGNKDVVAAHAAFEPKAKRYALSGLIPAKTVVIDSIEVTPGEKRKGYGSKMLEYIEEQARMQGMKRIHATFVMGQSESWWIKRGFSHSGRGRIWIKEL